MENKKAIEVIKRGKVKCNIEILIIKLLHELGIPSNIKGYHYIRDGIKLIYNNPDITCKIMQGLYLELANLHSTTIPRVESAIRRAIKLGWLRGNIRTIEEIFGYSIGSYKDKPTNSEYIITIAERLKSETSKTSDTLCRFD